MLSHLLESQDGSSHCRDDCSKTSGASSAIRPTMLKRKRLIGLIAALLRRLFCCGGGGGGVERRVLTDPH
jgi:hypothetical protein